jgi:hypothetical protein
MCVLIFSTNFVRNISHFKKNWEIWSKMFIGLDVKYRYSCQILMEIEFSCQIFEKYSDLKFFENLFNGSRVVQCGRTDGRTDMTNVVFFLLGDSSASEFYLPTFRNTLFHLHRWCREEVWNQETWRSNAPKKTPQSVNAVYGNNRCLFSDPHKTHKYSCVGRTQKFWLLNLVVNKVTTVL